MPALFVFLLKVNLALVIFCLGYYLVLRKLTFYTLNRVYLGIAIIFSSAYPLININGFLQRHQQLANPVQRVALNWRAPAEQFIQQPGYWYWATIIFIIGAIVFAARLLMQLISLYKLYRQSKPGVIQEHDVRVTKADISPFSFWQNIYINPDNIEPNDLENILQHEQVHVNEWHTLDILLAEISVIFYWFNPGVWLMKKAVRENIEFITDRKILQKGIDTKAYQYSLLNVSIAAAASAGITNHFNFSTLKKRIKMMNAKQSSNINLTRYAFLIPLVLMSTLVFSVSKAELVKKTKVAYKKITATVHDLVIVPKTQAVDESKKPAKKIADAITNKKQLKQLTFTFRADSADHRNYKFEAYKLPGEDSLTYFINGEKVDKASLNQKNLNFIEKIQVTDSYGNTIDPTKSITFIKKTGLPDLPGTPVGLFPGHHIVIFKDLRDSVAPGSKRGHDTLKIIRVNLRDAPGKGDGKPSSIALKKDEIRFKVEKTVKLDALSDKLIIVDGKQAEDGVNPLKNLQPSEISSINVQDSAEMVAKYGERAAKGVVFITTRKN